MGVVLVVDMASADRGRRRRARCEMRVSRAVDISRCVNETEMKQRWPRLTIPFDGRACVILACFGNRIADDDETARATKEETEKPDICLGKTSKLVKQKRTTWTAFWWVLCFRVCLPACLLVRSVR